MKKKYILAEFACVLVFLALPPLFYSPSTEGMKQQFTLSFSLFIQLFTALALTVQHHFLKGKTEASVNADENTSPEVSKSPAITSILLYSILTFFSMLIIYGLLSFLSLKFPHIFSGNPNTVVLPVNVLQWLLAVINLLCSAFYEEVVYRQFLPEALHELLPSSWSENKALFLLIEVPVVLLFGFSHRYMGLSAVLNALLSGILLRLCCFKTKTVYTDSAVHFIYNLLILILAFFTSNIA